MREHLPSVRTLSRGWVLNPMKFLGRNGIRRRVATVSLGLHSGNITGSSMSPIANSRAGMMKYCMYSNGTTSLVRISKSYLTNRLVVVEEASIDPKDPSRSTAQGISVAGRLAAGGGTEEGGGPEDNDVGGNKGGTAPI